MLKLLLSPQFHYLTQKHNWNLPQVIKNLKFSPGVSLSEKQNLNYGNHLGRLQ